MKSEGLQEDRQHEEFIKTRDLRYNYDETVINKCKTIEFTKRLGVNCGKVKSKSETTWGVFEHNLVLSHANVQGVINRWSGAKPGLKRSGTTIFRESELL